MKRTPANLSACIGFALALIATSAQAERMIGLVGTSAGSGLVRFDSNTPGSLTAVGPLSGALPGHSVRAIDFRPLDGKLYAVSHNGIDTGQLYSVDPDTAVMTPIGPGFALAYTGLRISMDFNPVADRLRVVDSVRDSLRVNPITGILAGTDSLLTYSAGDPQFGGTPAVADVAYANNSIGTSTTTLFAWDYTTDSLITIGSFGGAPVSPNSGMLFTVATPATRFTSSAAIGFDISGISSTAYVSHDLAAAPGVDQLDTVNLINGVRVTLGSFGATRVMDISAYTDRIFANGFQ
ncbi:MAG: DUF4394 domain-containing protein [Tahibacter sp.]